MQAAGRTAAAVRRRQKRQALLEKSDGYRNLRESIARSISEAPYPTASEEDEEGEREGEDFSVPAAEARDTANSPVRSVTTEFATSVQRAPSENNSVEEEDVWYDSRQRRKRCPHLFPKKLRRPCGKLMNDERFQMFIVLLICINSAMMGIATYDLVEDSAEASYWFRLTDYIFLVIFTIELLLQFVHKDVRIFLDGWLIFDFVVVVFSWTFSSMQVMRGFRIFRAFRLIGRIELLRTLVDAVISVIPRLLSIALLLFLVFYIFGVMFTQLFVSFDEYFGRLDVSIFTLFQMMTMDGWADIAREVMNEHSWAWVPFVSFVVVSGFVVVNLIVAVICDAIFVLHEKDEEREMQKIRKKEAELRAREQQDGEDSDSDEVDSFLSNITENRPPKEKTMLEEVEELTKQVDSMVQMHEQTRRALEQLIKQLNTN